MGDLHAPGMPDGAEDRLLVVRPTRRTSRSWCRPSVRPAAVTPRSTRSSSRRLVTPCRVRCSASARRPGSRGWKWAPPARPPAVRSHRGRRRAWRPWATIETVPVVEGEPTVRGAAGEVGVDDDNRGRLVDGSVLDACGCVQHRQGLRRCATAAELRPDPRPWPERLPEVAPLTPSGRYRAWRSNTVA